jgi:eukaryotic-like serine/threonine-protein kinase
LIIASGTNRAGQVPEKFCKGRSQEKTPLRWLELFERRCTRFLSRSNVPEAITELRAADPESGSADSLEIAYVRGKVYLSAKRGKEAASEFQGILDRSDSLGSTPIIALAHLGLARAYALQGDTAKAKAAYKDFLTLWKDADPDVPILKQAKVEYAKLQ